MHNSGTLPQMPPAGIVVVHLRHVKKSHYLFHLFLSGKPPCFLYDSRKIHKLYSYNMCTPRCNTLQHTATHRNTIIARSVGCQNCVYVTPHTCKICVHPTHLLKRANVVVHLRNIEYVTVLGHKTPKFPVQHLRN